MADDVTLKLGGDAKGAVDAFRQGGDAFGAFVSKASQQSAELNTRVREVFGVDTLARANSYAQSVTAVGGASKLTGDEKARLNGILTQALDKYKALGVQAPESIRKLAAETDVAEKKTSLFDSTMGRLTASFTAANLIDRGIGMLASWGREAVASASKTVDLSNRTGLTTETIQRMSFAAEQTGGSLDGLAQSAYQLGIRISTGNGSTREAVADLGLEYSNLQKLSPDDLFNRVMASLEGIEDPTERNRIAVRLFGGAAKEATQAAADGYTKVAASARVAEDAQLQAISAAADAWDGFLSDLGKGFQEVMGSIVLVGQQAYRELGTGISDLTATERQHIAALRKSGGDVSAYLAQVKKAHAEAAAAQKEQTAATTQAAAPQKTFAEQLALAERELTKLTAADRAEIAAAEQLGKSTDDITDKFGLSATAQRLLKDQTSQKADADKKAAEEVKKHGEEARKAYEDMFGITAQKKALEMAARLGEVGNVAKLTEEKKKALRDAVVAAIEVYDKAGREVPPTLRAIDDATRPLLENTRRWAFTELPAAVSAITPFQASVRSLGLETVPQFSASIHASRLGFVGYKAAIEDSREELAQLREEWRKSSGAAKEFGAQLANSILAAVQGGGNIGGAIGGTIGKEAGTWAGKQVGEWAGKAIGGSLGKAVEGALGAALPVIGTLLGQWGGALIGKLFGGVSPEIKKVRQEVDQFQQALAATLTATQRNDAGSVQWKMTVIAVRDAYLAAGRTAAEAEAIVRQLWDTDHPDRARAAMQQIQRVLGDVNLQQEILNRAVQTYGFTTEELGPKFRAQRLSEQAQQLVEDYAVLIESGIEQGTVIQRMSDKTNEYLQTALQTNTEIPRSMRPMLERMLEMGLLTDANGEKLTDLEGLTWAETMTQGFDRVVGAVERLIAAINGPLQAAVDDASNQTIHIGVQYDDPGFTPRGPDRGGEEFAAGTRGVYGRWFHDFGAEQAVRVHGREAIVPWSERGAFARDLLQFDPAVGRELAALATSRRTEGSLFVGGGTSATATPAAGGLDVRSLQEALSDQSRELAEVRHLLEGFPYAVATAVQDAAVLAPRRAR